MAHFIPQGSGAAVEVFPENGETFTLEELQKYVGGYIQTCITIDNRTIYMDEDAKIKGRHINARATLLYVNGLVDPVRGDVLVLDPSEELRDGD